MPARKAKSRGGNKAISRTFKSWTSEPTASISPAHSKPRTTGVLGGESMAPTRTIKSWKLRPLQQKARCVSAMTWPETGGDAATRQTGAAIAGTGGVHAYRRGGKPNPGRGGRFPHPERGPPCRPAGTRATPSHTPHRDTRFDSTPPR